MSSRRRPALPRTARPAGTPGTRRRSTTTPPAAAPPRRAVPSSPPKGLSRRSLVLLVLVVAVIASMTPTLRSYVAQQQQIAALKQDIRARESSVTGLQNELARWKDDAFVKAQARERFTYVMPGEVGYIVVGDTTEHADDNDPSAAAARAAASANGPWFTTVWNSVTAAGSDSASSDTRAPLTPGSAPTAQVPVAPTAPPTVAPSGASSPSSGASASPKARP